ncbi:MAG: nucleotide exchange factor GrpE, partial [Candidatus Colwellbacteria bacterium]|nr:nucleotide exchange factor GrpE [Candidatus Colwellbacteria bacterium]
MSGEEKKEEDIQEPKLLEEVDEVKVLNEELENISKERDEYLDGWRRSKADLVNYKKDEFKRLEEMAKFGNVDIIKELISVLDSINLGMLALE